MVRALVTESAVQNDKEYSFIFLSLFLLLLYTLLGVDFEQDRRNAAYSVEYFTANTLSSDAV